ncbi:hypothetical protein WG66_002753 [Moniliophthora roreri]|nr:hypothetical protein WG66_002753 [Moniliophthora roreri]
MSKLTFPEKGRPFLPQLRDLDIYMQSATSAGASGYPNVVLSLRPCPRFTTNLLKTVSLLIAEEDLSPELLFSSQRCRSAVNISKSFRDRSEPALGLSRANLLFSDSSTTKVLADSGPQPHYGDRRTIPRSISFSARNLLMQFLHDTEDLNNINATILALESERYGLKRKMEKFRAFLSPIAAGGVVERVGVFL